MLFIIIIILLTYCSYKFPMLTIISFSLLHTQFQSIILRGYLQIPYHHTPTLHPDNTRSLKVLHLTSSLSLGSGMGEGGGGVGLETIMILNIIKITIFTKSEYNEYYSSILRGRIINGTSPLEPLKTIHTVYCTLKLVSFSFFKSLSLFFL